MNAFELVTSTLTAEQINRLAHAGIIAPNTAMYIEIYAWHIANGRSKQKTADHFRLKLSTAGYAISQMNKTVRV